MKENVVNKKSLTFYKTDLDILHPQDLLPQQTRPVL